MSQKTTIIWLFFNRKGNSLQSREGKEPSLLIDCINAAGNAIASVRLSISLFPYCIFGTDWPLTLNFCH